MFNEETKGILCAMNAAPSPTEVLVEAVIPVYSSGCTIQKSLADRLFAHVFGLCHAKNDSGAPAEAQLRIQHAPPRLQRAIVAALARTWHILAPNIQDLCEQAIVKHTISLPGSKSHNKHAFLHGDEFGHLLLRDSRLPITIRALADADRNQLPVASSPKADGSPLSVSAIAHRLGRHMAATWRRYGHARPVPEALGHQEPDGPAARDTIAHCTTAEPGILVGERPPTPATPAVESPPHQAEPAEEWTDTDRAGADPGEVLVDSGGGGGGGGAEDWAAIGDALARVPVHAGADALPAAAALRRLGRCRRLGPALAGLRLHELADEVPTRWP
jgi:hypothetical protein